MTTIGQLAFAYCESLSEVHIPNSVSHIDSEAFVGCTSLAEISVGYSNPHFSAVGGVLYNYDKTTIVRYPPRKAGASFSVPESVTCIGDDAFEGCTELTSIQLPNSLNDVGFAAFEGCTGITSILIPQQVTGLIGSAFAGCENLIELLVAEGNETFMSEGGVLYDLEDATIVRYPPSKAGTAFSIPASVARVDSGAVEGCAHLTSILLPETITGIRTSAFAGCVGLTSIDLPNSLPEIGRNAFEWCTGLTNIKVPESVVRIESAAFIHCTGLRYVHLPKSEVNIDYLVFSGCHSLSHVVVDSATPLMIDEFAFLNTKLSKVTLHVPIGAKAAYAQAEVWRKFGQIVEDRP